MNSTLAGYDRELLDAQRSAFDGRLPTPAEAREFLTRLIGQACEQLQVRDGAAAK